MTLLWSEQNRGLCKHNLFGSVKHNYYLRKNANIVPLFRGASACPWDNTLKRTSLYLTYPLKLCSIKVHFATLKVIICTFVIKKVQRCTFKGITPVTSWCTPKGTIFRQFFRECKDWVDYFIIQIQIISMSEIWQRDDIFFYNWI